MPQATISPTITIEYESFGKTSDPAVILIMGMGAQLIHWPEEFVLGLVAAGFRVIRFDNRDIGLSTKLDHLGMPNIPRAMGKALRGKKVLAPYLIADMAADTLALCDVLQIQQAHFIGASMGGMLAQTIAAEHPERTLSLTSIMSTTSHPSVSKPNLKVALNMLFKPRNPSRADKIKYSMRIWTLLGSPAYPRQTAELRELCEQSYDRCYYPAGTARQLLASLASGNRVRLLKRITVPSLVIHGIDDPLVKVAAGIHTAQCIPNAQLELILGMGHEMPPALLPKLVKICVNHLK